MFAHRQLRPLNENNANRIARRQMVEPPLFHITPRLPFLLSPITAGIILVQEARRIRMGDVVEVVAMSCLEAMTTGRTGGISHKMPPPRLSVHVAQVPPQDMHTFPYQSNSKVP